MARRRKSYILDTLIGLMILLLIVFTMISYSIEWAKTHQNIIIATIVLLILFFVIKKIINFFQHRKWISYLKRKYNNDINIVNGIIKGNVWQGQSSEQLLDSLGKPVSIDRQVLKTKTKEVWKYYEIRKNQFALKVILEKNSVVGWDNKG